MASQLTDDEMDKIISEGPSKKGTPSSQDNAFWQGVQHINNAGGGIARGIAALPTGIGRMLGHRSQGLTPPFYDPNSKVGKTAEFAGELLPSFAFPELAFIKNAHAGAKIARLAGLNSAYGAALNPENPNLGAGIGAVFGAAGGGLDIALAKRAAAKNAAAQQAAEAAQVAKNANPEQEATNIMEGLTSAKPENHIEGYTGEPSASAAATLKEKSGMANNPKVIAELLKKQGTEQIENYRKAYENFLTNSPVQKIEASQPLEKLKELMKNKRAAKYIDFGNKDIADFAKKANAKDINKTLGMQSTKEADLRDMHNLQSYLGKAAYEINPNFASADYKEALGMQRALLNLQKEVKENIANGLGEELGSEYKGISEGYARDVVPYRKHMNKILKGEEKNPIHITNVIRKGGPEIQSILSHAKNEELNNRLAAEYLRKGAKESVEEVDHITNPQNMLSRYRTMTANNLAHLNRPEYKDAFAKLETHLQNKGMLPKIQKSYGITDSVEDSTAGGIGAALGTAVTHNPLVSGAASIIGSRLGKEAKQAKALENILHPKTNEEFAQELIKLSKKTKKPANASKWTMRASGGLNSLIDKMTRK